MKLNECNHTVTQKSVLFYGGPFSQWASAPFKVGQMQFNCAEQYMMYHKAMLFGDTETAKAIVLNPTPSAQKALGRQVKGFLIPVWAQVARGVVFMASYYKFTQNPEFKAVLLESGNLTLVEASPTDQIWGIGLSENHPDADDPAKWQGKNWLGEVLMQVRSQLQEKP